MPTEKVMINITIRPVRIGRPGPAMFKNSSPQVMARKTPTEGSMPQRLQDSGHFKCRPIEIGCRCQKLRRCTHSPAPPKGHIRHQARPAPTIITKTAQNQTYQVMAVEKLREGTATPMRPVAITNQKM